VSCKALREKHVYVRLVWDSNGRRNGHAWGTCSHGSSHCHRWEVRGADAVVLKLPAIFLAGPDYQCSDVARTTSAPTAIVQDTAPLASLTSGRGGMEIRAWRRYSRLNITCTFIGTVPYAERQLPVLFAPLFAPQEPDIS
jgi:hypothetical protein